MTLAPGMQIGKYVLRRKLGAGGYALVFAAHDPSLDREVALKVLKPEHASSEVVVRRFLQEARAAVRIVHPGIVTVFECGEISNPEREDLTAYIAMELLKGETLADRIARCGRLEAAVVIEIGRQLAAALGAAHRAGIIHRDLKPGNVFLIEDSLVAGGERAKVLDFGIAKLGRTHAPPGMQTGSLTVLGTWRYMSPEQCRSAGRIDPRADIYALGVMLFELLAGRTPFDGHAVELIAQHLTVPPPPLLALAPDAPAELAQLIGQLLEKEPDARPPTMEAVECALEAIADAEGLAPVRPSTLLGAPLRARTGMTCPPTDGETTIPGPRRAARRRKSMYAAASLLVIASGLGAFLGLRGTGTAPVSEVLAQVESPRQVVQLNEPVAEPAVAATGAEAREAAEGAAGAAEAARGAAVPAGELAEIEKAVEEPARARAKPAGARGNSAARSKASAPAAPTFGFLALVARPACEVYVDGRATGARTPLRELKLAAGKHRIRLVNEELAIQDSFAVVIGAGATERVAKDYSGQIKRRERDETIDPFAAGGR